LRLVTKEIAMARPVLFVLALIAAVSTHACSGERGQAPPSEPVGKTTAPLATHTDPVGSGDDQYRVIGTSTFPRGLGIHPVNDGGVCNIIEQRLRTPRVLKQELRTLRDFNEWVVWEEYFWRSGDGMQVKFFQDIEHPERIYVSIAGSVPEEFGGSTHDLVENLFSEYIDKSPTSYVDMVWKSLKAGLERLPATGNRPPQFVLAGHSQGANVATNLAAIIGVDGMPGYRDSYADKSPEWTNVRNQLRAAGDLVGVLAVAGRPLQTQTQDPWDRPGLGSMVIHQNEWTDPVPNLKTPWAGPDRGSVFDEHVIFRDPKRFGADAHGGSYNDPEVLGSRFNLVDAVEGFTVGGPYLGPTIGMARLELSSMHWVDPAVALAADDVVQIDYPASAIAGLGSILGGAGIRSYRLPVLRNDLAVGQASSQLFIESTDGDTHYGTVVVTASGKSLIYTPDFLDLNTHQLAPEYWRSPEKSLDDVESFAYSIKLSGLGPPVSSATISVARLDANTPGADRAAWAHGPYYVPLRRRFGGNPPILAPAVAPLSHYLPGLQRVANLGDDYVLRLQYIGGYGLDCRGPVALEVGSADATVPVCVTEGTCDDLLDPTTPMRNVDVCTASWKDNPTFMKAMDRYRYAPLGSTAPTYGMAPDGIPDELWIDPRFGAASAASFGGGGFVTTAPSATDYATSTCSYREDLEWQLHQNTLLGLTTELSPTTYGLRMNRDALFCHCPAGQKWDAGGTACACPDGLVWDARSKSCVGCPADGPPFDPRSKSCACPADGPPWDVVGKSCSCPSDGPPFDASTKSCTCPSTTPDWDATSRACTGAACEAPLVAAPGGACACAVGTVAEFGSGGGVTCIHCGYVADPCGMGDVCDAWGTCWKCPAVCRPG
jgi:hypothetical protein